MSQPLLLIPLILLASVTGALSMWLYKVCSPQQRLAEVVVRIKETQRQLLAYDGEFAGAQPLILDSLKLSLQRLGMVLFPSAMAAAPVIAMLTRGMGMFEGLHATGVEPAWYATTECLFLLVATVSAFVVKFVFRVQC
jgi:hypothetical protein